MSKKIFVYLDDDKDAVVAFENAARENWNLNCEVISNKIFGQINKENYDIFKNQVLSDIRKNLDMIECIFLDLDFSGGKRYSDKTGFIIGQEIRHECPQLPIIIATRFTEIEIWKKGMVFDFDNVIKPGELLRKDYETFHGIIDIAKKKRMNILKNISDIPISYLRNNHTYFKPLEPNKKEGRFAFIAMPFDSEAVSKDVYEFAIKDAFKGTGIVPVRVDFEKNTFSIIDKIAYLIYNCFIMVADITYENPNVMYELGIAHSTNIRCITLMQKGVDSKIPFDIRHLKTIIYDKNDLSALREELRLSVTVYK